MPEKIIQKEGGDDKVNLAHQLDGPNDRIAEIRQMKDQAIAVEHADDLVFEIKEKLHGEKSEGEPVADGPAPDEKPKAGQEPHKCQAQQRDAAWIHAQAIQVQGVRNLREVIGEYDEE